MDPWLPGAGTVVVMPKQRLLPRAPRSGIVINLPEHRLYWYPPTPAGQEPVVWTFPVSIGKMDWNTPLGRTTIVSKAKDAPWIPPKSVREEHEKRGEPLPAVVPGGPDNPMGRYKMALGIPGGAYLIHGTNRPAGIGMQVTHGCMRLYPEDIETLYGMVPIGTSVTIVNQPYKWGWQDGELLIEVHPPLQEDAVRRLRSRISRASSSRRPARTRSPSTGSAPSAPGARRAAFQRRLRSPSRAPSRWPRPSRPPRKQKPRGVATAGPSIGVRRRLLRHRLFEHAIHLDRAPEDRSVGQLVSAEVGVPGVGVRVDWQQ